MTESWTKCNTRRVILRDFQIWVSSETYFEPKKSTDIIWCYQNITLEIVWSTTNCRKQSCDFFFLYRKETRIIFSWTESVTAKANIWAAGCFLKSFAVENPRGVGEKLNLSFYMIVLFQNPCFPVYRKRRREGGKKIAISILQTNEKE